MSDPTQYNILWGRLEDERRSHRAYQQKLKARIAELEELLDLRDRQMIADAPLVKEAIAARIEANEKARDKS